MEAHVAEATQRMIQGLTQGELAVEGLTQELIEATNAADMARLATEIKAGLVALKAGIDDLRTYADEQQRASSRELILAKLAVHERAHKSLSVGLRRAKMASSVAAARAASDERAQLMGGTDEEIAERRRALTNERAQAMAGEVTSSLLRSRQMLGDSVARSYASLGVLDNTSSRIRDINAEYATYGSAVSAGAQAIGKIESRDTTDKLLVTLAALLFFCCVAFVFASRLRLFALLSIFSGGPAADDDLPTL